MQIDLPKVNDLFAAEAQQLTGQLRAAFGRRSDLFESFGQLRREVLLLHQAAGVALHLAEQNAEVLPEVGGQLPNGLHLFRLSQLRPDVESLGNVPDEPRENRRTVAGNACDSHLNGEFRPVGTRRL